MVIPDKVNASASPMEAKEVAGILYVLGDLQGVALRAYATDRSSYDQILDALYTAGETIRALCVERSQDCGWQLCADGSCQPRCPKTW